MGRYGFCLEVWGPLACFTRPEMKVERVSYDVITPSAARAIYSAILWKPAIRWRIDRIDVLAPIRWINIRRNEVAKVSMAPILITGENIRTQRASLMLRGVRYRLHAHFDFIPPAERPKVYESAPDWLTPEPKDEDFLREAKKKGFLREAGLDETPAKYAAMFERRAKRGQCFIRPYLGCRECAADFRLVENPTAEKDQPISEDRDLGFMLYDLDFTHPQAPQPMFYHAKMTRGVIHVPSPDSEEVKR